jgi:hypothetical protein
MGKWMLRSTHSWPLRQMALSGLLDTRVASPTRKVASGTHWIGFWVGPRTGLDDIEKRKFLILSGSQIPTPTASSPWSVAVPTALPHLQLSGKVPNYQQNMRQLVKSEQDSCFGMNFHAAYIVRRSFASLLIICWVQSPPGQSIEDNGRHLQFCYFKELLQRNVTADCFKTVKTSITGAGRQANTGRLWRLLYWLTSV